MTAMEQTKKRRMKRGARVAFTWGGDIMLGKVDGKFSSEQYLIIPYRTRLALVVSESKILYRISR